MATTPTRLSVLSFGSAPPPAVAQLPANVSLNLVDQQLPSSTAVDTETGAAPIDLAHVARTVLKAKRVAVVCGAGISTASGIPDFRSGAGLFESLKKQYPDAKLSSGKDLFDVGLFASESNAAIFFNMIAELKKQTDAVEPTAFHSWLKQLDDDGKLFRVYTQNIDALEEKAGLTYGLGDKSLPLPPRRKGTAAPPAPPPRSPSKSSTTTTTTTRTSTPLPPPPPSSFPLEPTSSQASIASSSSTVDDTPPPPPPPATHSAIPRVIPLHGHLSTLSCSACKHEVPLSGAYVDLLSTGSAPLCPACLSIDQARSAAGERSRGVGMMRPDVVLYGEEHKDGDRVGEITQRDLMGQRPDLLIVVGTTLKVKGTKRLVRELAKVIRPPQQASTSAGRDEDSSSTAATSPSKPQRKRRAPPRPPPIHTLYLNYDFPTPSKEWAGVFDCWLRGDIQEFVEAVKREEEVLKQEQEGKERKRGEKRKREEEQQAAGRGGGGAVGSDSSGIPTKRMANGKGKGKGKATTTVRKLLVPARNANPPSPLRPLPPLASSQSVPPPLARTDPNGRTRSSLHHHHHHHQQQLPPPPSILGGPFAPVAAEQHYRQPYQSPAGLALAAPSSATPFMPGPASLATSNSSSSSFAPFSQRPFGGGANHFQAASSSSSSSSSMGASSFPLAPSQPVLWNNHKPLPALPIPGYDAAPSVSSSGTAPFSTVSTTEQDRHQRDEEMISNMATTTTLRRQVSSSSLSSLSDEDEVDETEEEEMEDAEVETNSKVGNKQQQQQQARGTAAAPATQRRRGNKVPKPPLQLAEPPLPPRSPRPPQPRRGSGMSTRSSMSASGSDNSKGLAQLSVAVAAAAAPSSSSISASRSSSSSSLPPPPSALPRRRSPRSSTSTSLEQHQQQQDAAKRSRSTVVGAKKPPGRRPQTRSSVSPPTTKATTGKASKMVTTMTHEQQLKFNVTKATVAKVTGTARKRK